MKVAPLNFGLQSEYRVAKKYVPKDLYKDAISLMDRMLIKEASYVEKNGEFFSEVISSVENKDGAKFFSGRIAGNGVIKDEYLRVGKSTLRIDGKEFTIDNATGAIFTTLKESKEKISDLLNKGNLFLKSVLEEFNSPEVIKNRIGMRGLLPKK